MKIFDVKIVLGDKEQVRKLKSAFKLLESVSPRYFKKIKTLNSIVIYPKNGYDNELDLKNRIWICKKWVVEKNSIEWVASLLLHEAEHLLQYDNKRDYSGERAEHEAYEKQKNFLIKIKYAQKDWLDNVFKKLFSEKQWEKCSNKSFNKFKNSADIKYH